MEKISLATVKCPKKITCRKCKSEFEQVEAGGKMTCPICYRKFYTKTYLKVLGILSPALGVLAFIMLMLAVRFHEVLFIRCALALFVQFFLIGLFFDLRCEFTLLNTVSIMISLVGVGLIIVFLLLSWILRIGGALQLLFLFVAGVFFIVLGVLIPMFAAAKREE